MECGEAGENTHDEENSEITEVQTLVKEDHFEENVVFSKRVVLKGANYFL